MVSCRFSHQPIHCNHGSKITVSQFDPQAAANIDWMLNFTDLTATADFHGMFLRLCVLKLLRDYERIYVIWKTWYSSSTTTYLCHVSHGFVGFGSARSPNTKPWGRIRCPAGVEWGRTPWSTPLAECMLEPSEPPGPSGPSVVAMGIAYRHISLVEHCAPDLRSVY